MSTTLSKALYCVQQLEIFCKDIVTNSSGTTLLMTFKNFIFLFDYLPDTGNNANSKFGYAIEFK